MTSAATRSLSTRRRRRLQLGLLVGLAAATISPAITQAQTDPTSTVAQGGDYVTTTTVPQESLDVSGFSPECIRDAPFIRYAIVPQGFTPTSTQATLTIRDRNGNLVQTQTVNSFTGTILWPGAAVDANGNATDWPGWRLADDGVSFIPDPSDAFLREGLSIEVTVNPTATATVSYPPATSACANPPDGTPPTTTVPGPTTTVCVPGQNNDGNPNDDCTPVCVPGQNNDGNPADDCTLPDTGGGPGNALIIGAGALLAGVLFLTASRRRRNPDASPSAG
jgi:LPXTG-motif cell wall-anchored protein